MSLLVAINIVVFAIVFSLFALETGAALLNLIDYESYGEKTTEYIRKTWAISGTFVVFYVVNFEATFPLLLTAAGTLYIVPVLIAGLCIIFRNAFIAYSEYSGGYSKRVYTSVYAIATLLAVLVLVSVLNSTVTGTSIDLNSLSVNYISLVFNPYNIIMFICAAFTSLAAAIVFLGIERPFGMHRVPVFILLLALILITFLVANYTYAPFVIHGLLAKWYYLVPAVVLLLLVLSLCITGRTKRLNIITFLWLVATVSGYETLGHPTLFGGALNIDSTLTSPGGTFASLLFTSITAIVLIIGIGLLLYANSKPKKSSKY